jgi:hypothetical protein
VAWTAFLKVQRDSTPKISVRFRQNQVKMSKIATFVWEK